MNSRRTIILLVAVVLGAVASAGLLTYIRSLETEATKDAEMGTVWMVRDVIPKGTLSEAALAGGMIFETSMPLQYLPGNAVGDPRVELVNHIAAIDIQPNTMLTAGLFVPPSVYSSGITDRLEERGMVTVTFQLDQVRGVGSMVQPGDFVNILRVPGDGINGTVFVDEVPPAGVGEGTVESPLLFEDMDRMDYPYTYDVRYIYQKAEVLAVDQRLPADVGASVIDSETGVAPLSGGLITLAVPPEAAQLLLIVGLENLYLSLVPGNYEPYAIVRPERERLLPAEDPARLTPYPFVAEEEEGNQ